MLRLTLLALCVSSAFGAIAVGTSLPQGNVGQAYNAVLAPSGGTAPYTHVVSAGNLPAGVSLSTAGVLSGTPLAAGQYTFSVQTTDSLSATGVTSLGLLVNSTSGLIISTATLPAGRIGTPYDVTLAAQGGTAPYSFDLFLGGGALPPGLALAATGRIFGTPTASGVFPIIVRVTDNGGNSFQAAFTLRIEAASLTITTTSLAGAPSNVPYSQTITAVGGTPPYTFDLLSGTLPPGLTLAPNGAIAGTPTASGTYNFFIRVTDAGGMTAQASYSVVVAGGGPRLIISSLPTGIVNQPFAGALLAQGGTAPYTFTLLSGSLPAGLTLNQTGAISGTPTASGVFPITVRLTDSAGQSTQADVLINVNSGAFNITNTTAPEGFVNSSYSLNLTTAGGTGNVAYTLLSGTLPPGITLGVNGALTGTPTTAGTYLFVVRAIDSVGATAQVPLTVRIDSSTLVISQAGLANGQLGQSYSSTLSASNGQAPYAFSLASGSLPPGLTLATNGNVSGIPTASGLFQAAIRVTDSTSATATLTVPIFIASNGLTFTTFTIPSARQNQAYAAVLQAGGGTPPYAFQLAEGTIPAGLTLSPSGLLSGTPSQSASSLFTVRVTDGGGASSFVTFNFNVNNSNIALISATPVSGQIGTAYSSTLITSGGSGAVAYSLVSGALPPGLSLNANGTISGTPTAAGTYLYSVRATDAGNNTATFTQVITISSSQLSFGNVQLADVILGTQYAAALTGVGGLPPYSFSIASGALPPGLSLSTTGNITGVATSIGTYSVTFRITDANGATATLTRSLNVSATAGLVITNTALPTARRGTPYVATVFAAGGMPPYSFSLMAGSALPAGLTLSSAGLISGTPTVDGSATFVVRAQDATGANVQRALSLTVTSSTLNITNETLPNAVIGTPYNATALPTGGVAPYTFALSSGALPPGLTLSPTGVLSGTPTTAGTYSVIIGLADGNGVQIQKAYSISVGTSNLAFSTTSLPSVFTGQNYRATLQATGGVTPFTYSIVSGALPTGLTLSSAGVISGTPTSTGQSAVTFRVTDAAGATAVSTLVLGSVQPTIGFGFTTIPSFNVGQAVNFAATGTGGSGPYTFIAVAGLPPGLTLSSAGVLSGTPTQDGTFNVLLRATDAAGAVVESTFPVTVAPAGFRFTIQALPNAAVNQAYSQTLTTTGATGNVTFSLQSGSLPAGLTLTPTGLLSGTPSVIGTSTFTVRAVDSANMTITRELTLTVANPTVSFTTNTLPSGTVNQSYNQPLAVSGGAGPYSFTLNSGTLPAGLTLSPAGVISGTPTATGTSTFGVRVTDSQNQAATAEFLIGIGAVGAPNAVAVVSSADYAGNGVAPGEIVLIYGTNLGPAALQSFTVVNNSVATTLGGTRVLFDGVPAPVIYTSVNQVAVVAPFNLVGKTSVRVTVESAGVTSATIQIPVRATKPAIFTQDASGNGPGAILNQNATLNTAQNPEDRGNIVSLYLTGVGQTNPAGVDGQVVSTIANLVIQPTLTINGQAADVIYAGNAPGLVPGVAQINVRIPASAVSGANVIRVTSSGATSSGNVTVFVR
jgi:uncharacterized protein (TIGR03437 family)